MAEWPCGTADWLDPASVVFGERHLRDMLLSYLAYYNGARTHLSLNKDAPYRGLFRPLGAFTRAQFSADYTTRTFGSNLRQAWILERGATGL